MTVVTAPEVLTRETAMELSVFLAGSIEMGKADDWQSKVQDKIKDKNVVLLNPRRRDWDSTWTQESEDMRLQIKWEQDMMFHADIVLFNFLPETKSPVTMLELGQCLGSKWGSNQNIVVCCPKNFWRYANIKHTCARYGVNVHEYIDDAIQEVNYIVETWV